MLKCWMIRICLRKFFVSLSQFPKTHISHRVVHVSRSRTRVSIGPMCNHVITDKNIIIPRLEPSKENKSCIWTDWPISCSEEACLETPTNGRGDNLHWIANESFLRKQKSYPFFISSLGHSRLFRTLFLSPSHVSYSFLPAKMVTTDITCPTLAMVRVLGRNTIAGWPLNGRIMSSDKRLSLGRRNENWIKEKMRC